MMDCSSKLPLRTGDQLKSVAKTEQDRQQRSHLQPVQQQANDFKAHRDPDYRAIPSTVAADDLLCSHISINFDRTGFQEDWNVVFPLDRLNELAAEGTINSVAATHYSFMGATDPVQMEPYARELAGRLKADAVDAVILSPV